MEPVSYIRFIIVLALIIGVILIIGGLFRRYGQTMMTGRLRRSGGRNRRLQVVESVMIDPRRRLVLVSRDGIEHLLLVGGTTEVVVESPITPPPTTPDQPVPTDTPTAGGDGPSRPRSPDTASHSHTRQERP